MGWLRKRWVLATYRRKLGKALLDRYGREPGYSPAQIRTTLEILGLPVDYLRHACAGYSNREQLAELGGDPAEWAQLRREMAPRFPRAMGNPTLGTHEIDTTAAVGASVQNDFNY